jgi:DNA-binding PadR family transcriptional regulator
VARTKVYTPKELEDATAKGGLKRYGAGVFTTEGNESYVLFEPKDPDTAPWLHPTEGLVKLYNTHMTGELRWDVMPELMSGVADDVEAVMHFKLTPADMPPAKWREVLAKFKFAMKDLSPEEQELIKRTNDRGEGLVTRPPDDRKLHSAIWDAMRKGIVYLEAEMSGGGGPKHTWYRLTPKGRRLKAGKKNPKSKVAKKATKQRRRAKDLRDRSRSDRLRRLLRGA